MARSFLWFAAQRLRLTTSDAWVMPSLADCSDYANAYLMVTVDAISGNGTLTVALQTAPFPAIEDAAWTTVASGTISARGALTLVAGEFATIPIMGVLRVRVSCANFTTTFNLRAELLLKRQVESRLYEVWLPPTPMNFAGSGIFDQIADQWLDCSQFLWAFGLVRYVYGGTGGSTNLTVAMQTATDLSAPYTVWEDAASGTVNDSTNVRVLSAAGTGSPPKPIQGALRIKAESAGALAGTLQIGVLLKDS